MTCVRVLRLILIAVPIGLASNAVHAGGFSGGGGQISPIAPQQAQAILSFADRYRDGNFRVDHTETAGAYAEIGPKGETGSGYGQSDTQIESGAGVKSWKRTVQRSSGHTTNGAASGNGFSASFVKIRTSDGKYYMFKGMTSAGASANASGASSQTSGLAKSAGGRF